MPSRFQNLAPQSLAGTGPNAGVRWDYYDDCPYDPAYQPQTPHPLSITTT